MEIDEKLIDKEILHVQGIVAVRNGLPYIVLSKTIKGKEERITQLSVAAARNFVNDILTMCARTEADAMIFKFFEKEEFPQNVLAALMNGFREFRHELDNEFIEKTVSEPTIDNIGKVNPKKTN